MQRPADSATISEAFACKTGDQSYLELLRRTEDLPPDWQRWLATKAPPARHDELGR
jgi:hypothetical protein